MKTASILSCVLAAGLLAHCSHADSPTPQAAPGKAIAREAPVFTLDALENKDAGDNRLFLDYNPAGNARWNQGWPGRIDLTGVAWDSPRTATAVTPRHVVMAAHYPRRPGDTLVFHDRSGKRHTRTLIKTVSLRAAPAETDIAVGLLDQPLPETIKTYPLLQPATGYADRLAGGPVLVTDHQRRLFIHEIRFVNTKSLRLTHGPSFKKSMHKFLIQGDSGNPSFLLVGGEPVLVETHSMGGLGAGPFYAIPAHYQGLERAVRSLDSRYRLRVVTLDDRYARNAAARRAGRKEYIVRNTDGSLKKSAEPLDPPRPATKPAPAISPPTADPNARKHPRLRRVPTTKSS